MQADSSSSAAAAIDSSPATEKTGTEPKKATCIICIGMAGSGKTTFVQRLNSYLHILKKPPYVINLDPAVAKLPFQANIDIRDTVDYKEVMNQYSLGPNGGILTALNLFTTKFDQVLSIVEKRAETTDYIIVDTPGQIEIFTWSASGAIITDALASAMPTCVAYVIDTPRSAAPSTFMSNMLYACSILYKTRLPFLLVFNKTDVQGHQFALEWMRDFETFQAALLAKREQSDDEDSGGYMGSLMSSMSLVLDEFYQNLSAVGCSAMTGFGMKEFFNSVSDSRLEYNSEYLPELRRRQSERTKKQDALKEANLSRLVSDMHVSTGGPKRGGQPPGPDPAALKPEEVASNEAEFAENEGETLDRSEFLERGPGGAWAADRSARSGASAVRRGMGVEEDTLGGRWPAPR